MTVALCSFDGTVAKIVSLKKLTQMIMCYFVADICILIK
jgi:hypothetical protein